jgi:hypothetical protein
MRSNQESFGMINKSYNLLESSLVFEIEFVNVERPAVFSKEGQGTFADDESGGGDGNSNYFEF